MKVGNDDFCSKCMEWREYDDNGKCVVCGSVIHQFKSVEVTDGYNEYKGDYSCDEFEDDDE